MRDKLAVGPGTSAANNVIDQIGVTPGVQGRVNVNAPLVSGKGKPIRLAGDTAPGSNLKIKGGSRNKLIPTGHSKTAILNVLAPALGRGHNKEWGVGRSLGIGAGMGALASLPLMASMAAPATIPVALGLAALMGITGAAGGGLGHWIGALSNPKINDETKDMIRSNIEAEIMRGDMDKTSSYNDPRMVKKTLGAFGRHVGQDFESLGGNISRAGGSTWNALSNIGQGGFSGDMGRVGNAIGTNAREGLNFMGNMGRATARDANSAWNLARNSSVGHAVRGIGNGLNNFGQGISRGFSGN